jgi:hypothetical protein
LLEIQANMEQRVSRSNSGVQLLGGPAIVVYNTLSIKHHDVFAEIIDWESMYASRYRRKAQYLEILAVCVMVHIRRHGFHIYPTIVNKSVRKQTKHVARTPYTIVNRDIAFTWCTPIVTVLQARRAPMAIKI